MNRREALKRIGYSFGLIVGTPTALTILQGCASEPKPNWEPKFFSEDEAYITTIMTDVILPATESSPAASEVGVPQFIDQYINEVVSIEEMELTRDYMGNITNQLKKESGKNVASMSKEDIEPLVARSLEKTPKEENKVLKELNNYIQSKQQKKETELFSDVASYAFITNLRELAIWSYKTSQHVGENILAYESIPGRQQGCVDLNEATNGKAWSL